MNDLVVYPGTFDPITNGHIDLIERSRKIFGRVLVGVATGDDKRPLFTLQERVQLVTQATAQIPDVTVESFGGLFVDFLRARGARVVIRGLRAVSDFEYELQMALTNRQLCSDIETTFLMPSQENIFLSSRIVKTVASLGGDVSPWVPQVVFEALKRKFGGQGMGTRENAD